MLNGKLDHFPVETSQIPMFQAFGTPQEHKRHVVCGPDLRSDRVRCDCDDDANAD
jgi:hypothetical protein